MAKGQKTGGRRRGTPNRMPAALREMIHEALHNAGGIDYLVRQASENPTAFLTLLAKTLPKQITGAENGGAIEIIVRTDIAAPNSLNEDRTVKDYEDVSYLRGYR